MSDGSPQEKKSKPTLHDVALLAGVSAKTVSRVLRKEAKVSGATRAAVERAAAALGYLPDLAARNLRSDVPSAIGLLRVSRGDEHPRAGHEYTMALQIGALRACAELDISLLVMSVPRRAAEALSIIRQQHSRHLVGGYIVSPPVSDIPDLLQAMTAEDIPYSVISPSQPDLTAPCVLADERSASEQLVQHLIERGHRRIGLIRGAPGSLAAREREAGYRDALLRAGIAIDPKMLEQANDFSFDDGRRCAHRLLGRPPVPTAIFASSDDLACGVMAAAQERGLMLPDQLSVVGYDDLEVARKVWPSLTTARQPIEQMGEIAARQIILALQPTRFMDAPPAQRVTLKAEVITRGSVADAPRVD